MSLLRLLGDSAEQIEDRVAGAVTDNGGTLLYFHARKGPKAGFVAFVEFADPTNAAKCRKELQSTVRTSVCLEPGKIMFPVADFQARQRPTPGRLRVGQCTPVVSDFDVTYTFDSPAARDLLMRVYRDFREADFTHFACVPIGPCFPEFKAALNELGRQWGFIPEKADAADLFHLTVMMFVAHGDEDVEVICRIMDESMREVEWPSNRVLEFPKLGTFGRPEDARILYAAPVGELMQPLAKYVAILAEKARDHGFTRISEADVFHGTVARPGFLGKEKSFDARPMIRGYAPGSLPPVEISELRFVKRGVFDDDKFYHTERVFAIPR